MVNTPKVFVCITSRLHALRTGNPLHGPTRRTGFPQVIDLQARTFLRAGGPSRSLKNLLQEAGVPPWLRRDLPLLWVDGRLAWIAGVGVAAEFRCRPGESGVMPDWSVLAG